VAEDASNPSPTAGMGWGAAKRTMDEGHTGRMSQMPRAEQLAAVTLPLGNQRGLTDGFRRTGTPQQSEKAQALDDCRWPTLKAMSPPADRDRAVEDEIQGEAGRAIWRR